MKQRAEITFETEETIVLRQGSCVRSAFCPACGECVLMASPRTIAAVSTSTEREIFRLVEHDKIHYTETDRVLICLRSINALSRR